jgi:hypothetical protein
LPALQRAIELAKADWRDLLVAAGFAEDIHAHEHWSPRLLTPEIVGRWMVGDGIEGVYFARGESVQFRRGKAIGSVGSVVSLLALEPEPAYGVLVGGREVRAEQFWLQSAPCAV